MAVLPGDVVRINAVMTSPPGDDQINVFHFKVVVNSAPSDLVFMQEVALYLDGLYTIINAQVSPGLTYVAVDGQNVTTPALLPSVAWPSLTTGGGTGATMPLQIAAEVFFPTTRPKTRASKFFGALTQSVNTGSGVINATVVALLQSLGDQLVIGIATVNVVADYGAFNAPLARFTGVDRAIVPSRLRTQRRRRTGVGA